MNELDFQEFPKMARLNREVVITEKIDGTNAQILITPPPEGYDHDDPANSGIWLRDGLLIRAGSRNRWLTPGKQDNAGFAGWVLENCMDLLKLGPGRHFGEWWGASIQRRYGLDHKRFSLFNVGRWMIDSSIDTPPNTVERWGQDVHKFQHVPLVEVIPGPLVNGVPGPSTYRPGPTCCHVVPTIWRGNFDLFDCRSAVEMLRVHGSFAAPGWKTPEGIVVYHEAAKKCFKVTLENDEKRKSDLTSA